ncbi:MAG: metallophosphoesterase [Anaerovoracaceae bacterium]
MKIFVISDTHGMLSKAIEVFEGLTDIDLIIHCGDYDRDAINLGDYFGVDVITVKGNSDGSYSDDDYKIVDTPYGQIYVTHGHMQNVNFSYDKIYYTAAEKNCIAAIFGHTHKPIFEENNGIYMINPGSLSMPRDGSQGSYAIIHSSKEDFYGSIIYYDDIVKTPKATPPVDKKKKVQGGFLRGLLNHSDRF